MILKNLIFSPKKRKKRRFRKNRGKGGKKEAEWEARLIHILLINYTELFTFSFRLKSSC
jgi:hypothetical protein